MPAVPTYTTTAGDLSASGQSLVLTSVTGISAGTMLLVGQELMKVRSVDTANVSVAVTRGREGTRAVAHNSGAFTWVFASGGYEVDKASGKVAVSGYTGELGPLVLPIGSKYFDPDTGNEYILVETGASLIVGEWVAISGAGVATQLAIGTKGRVGIIVEAAVASDQVAWALVAGTFASALLDSDVTTAMQQLGAAAGFAAPYDSTNHTWIQRAVATVAPSTATSPAVGDGIGTVYIDHPWCAGPDFVS